MAARKIDGKIEYLKMPSTHINKKIFKSEPSIVKEIWIMFKSSLQIALSMMFEICVHTITAMFYGQLQNSSQIASGTQMALSFVNMTATATSWGFTSALWTLVPQAVGSNNSHLIKVYVQRAFIVSIIIGMPLSILLFYSKNILLFLSVNTDNDIDWDIIENTCIALIPFPYLVTSLSILHRIAQNLNYNFEILVIQGITFFLSIPLNYFLIYVFDFGYIAGAYVWSITLLSSISLMILLLVKKGHSYVFKPLPLRVICEKQGLVQYLQLGSAGCLQAVLVWSMRESLVILTGNLANAAIAGACTAAMKHLNSIILLHSGIGNAFTIRIGNYIGNGAKTIKYAKRCIKIQLSFALLLFLFVCVTYIIFRYELTLLFTNNQQVIEFMTKKLIYIGLIDQLMMAVDRNVRGIYRALGYQKQTVYILFVTQCLIALPAQIYLLFGFKYVDNMEMGISIIWIGSICGYFLADVILILMLVYYVDWDKAVQESKLRIKLSNESYHKTHSDAVHGLLTNVNGEKQNNSQKALRF